MASGLRPEQGEHRWRRRCRIDRSFVWWLQISGIRTNGGFFIPVIQSIVKDHDYAFLILASVVAGIVLMAMGLEEWAD